MANPASLLHQQLSSWNNHQVSAEEARTPDTENWLLHRVAVRHLEAIEHLLHQLESRGRSMDIYRAYYPHWTKAVFSYPSGWTAPASGGINGDALNHLRTLGDWLDDFVPTAQESALDQLREYTKLVRDTMETDDSLPVDLRGHVNEVIRHVEWCLANYSIMGDFELRTAVEHLAAATMQAASASSDKAKWRDVAKEWVWPFVRETAVVTSSTLFLQLMS